MIRESAFDKLVTDKLYSTGLIFSLSAGARSTMMTHFNSMTAPTASLSAGALKPSNTSATTRLCFSIARSKSVTPQILPQDVLKAAYREDDEARGFFMTTRVTNTLWLKVLSHWTARTERRKRLPWMRVSPKLIQASIWSKCFKVFGNANSKMQKYLNRCSRHILSPDKKLLGRWFWLRSENRQRCSLSVKVRESPP